MQSNFGVVVKMGVWLMPWPEVYAPMWLTVPREEDLIPLIDTVRRLRLDRTIEGVPPPVQHAHLRVADGGAHALVRR